MNNVTRVVNSGTCTGCNACSVCEHISFKQNNLGFYSPVVDSGCLECGKCLENCIFDYSADDN